jgi:hypothetical protein
MNFAKNFIMWRMDMSWHKGQIERPDISTHFSEAPKILIKELP